MCLLCRLNEVIIRLKLVTVDCSLYLFFLDIGNDDLILIGGEEDLSSVVVDISDGVFVEFILVVKLYAL